MKNYLLSLCLLLLAGSVFAQPFTKEEKLRWRQRAENVTIVRDSWGVPHIYGKTDADVVFGLMYAQCEDDFDRVEYQYIKGLGRLSEIEGEGLLMNDLYARAFSDSAKLVGKYGTMDPAMVELMNAYADGMNYFISKHPDRVKLIRRYKPWYPLVYSEGSSEGNTSNQTDVSRREIAEYFSSQHEGREDEGGENKGSNGFALAPGRTANGNAMLVINPHVSVYHRLEAHLISEQENGLDVYGAVSKGQFFVYHGFNNYCGWMHTSSGTDTQDSFLETVAERNGKLQYKFGDEWRDIISKEISLKYRKEDGSMANRRYTVHYTHHGPIMARRGDYLVSLTPLHMPEKEIEQEWKTMKAKGLEDFKKVMSIRSNATNNTVYADVDGNIAYWNGNFVPKRNPAHNWRSAVPSAPENDWMGLHPLDEIIQVINPASSYIQNCNSTPFLAAGPSSPKPADYPSYMTGHHHNPRAANAIRLLEAADQFTPDLFRQMAYDNYLQLFDLMLPRLFKAFDNLSENDSQKDQLGDALALLRQWDQRATVESEAVLLGEQFAREVSRLSGKYIPRDTIMGMNQESYPNIVIARDRMSDEDFLLALTNAQNTMMEKYGSIRMALGDINRFQRIQDHPTRYDDNAPSIPSRFVTGFLGSLPAANYSSPKGVDKNYYAGGNSFIAVINFDAEQVEAWSIVGGGQSADPTSPHYTDQAEMFMNGELKKVFFTEEAIKENTERSYHPGE